MKKDWPYYLLFVVVTAFAVGRFGVEAHDAVFDRTNLFKTAAHFFLAGLIGYGIGKKVWWVVAPVVFLTVIELIAFSTSGAKISFQ